MACFVPICVMIERTMADGAETFLLASDLATALADAARALEAGEWTARRISMGRDTVLEGEALTRAIEETELPEF